LTEAVGPNTPVRIAAREALAGAMGEVVRRLRALKRKGPKSAQRVHSFRVATRRATAAIRLFEDSLDPAEAARAKRLLRRLRRAAGLVRIGDVHLDILRSGMNGRLDPDTPGASALIKATKRQRREDRRALEGQLTGKMVRRVRRASKRVVSGVLHDADSLVTMASRWISGSGRQTLERADAAAADPKHFHDARIDFKRFRYGAELLAPCYPPAVMDAVLVWLAEVQDRMGAVNDLFELVEMLSPDPGESPDAFADVLRTLRAEGDQAYRSFAEWWVGSGRQEFSRVVRPMMLSDGPVVRPSDARRSGRTLVAAAGGSGG